MDRGTSTAPRNQMTNVPGLFAAGECEYQYHGANRLGANALLTCLVGGEITAQGVLAYLQQAEGPGNDVSSALADAAQLRLSEYCQLKQSNGKENPYRLHAELADVMWNNCGIWRVQRDLFTAKDKLDDLAARARQCDLIDGSGWNNQAVPFTRAVINMIEQSKAIVGGAIVRDESRGAHFKMDTPARDDEHWLKTTLAKWTPQGPEFSFEPIDTRFLAPRARKYAVNQLSIVTKLMGDDVLKDISPAPRNHQLVNKTSSALPRSTPAAEGVDETALLTFIDRLGAEDLETHSLMILRNGRVVVEGWWAPYQPETPHLVYSLTKSFMSTAVGFAVVEGLFGLDDLIVDLFPGQAPENPGPNLSRLKVRHLLTMTVGYEVEPVLPVRGGSWEACVKIFLAHPIPYPPVRAFLLQHKRQQRPRHPHPKDLRPNPRRVSETKAPGSAWNRGRHLVERC